MATALSQRSRLRLHPDVRGIGIVWHDFKNGRPVCSATSADRGVRVSDAEARPIKLNQSAFVPSYDRRREEEL